jgi:hypothetical protein
MTKSYSTYTYTYTHVYIHTHTLSLSLSHIHTIYTYIKHANTVQSQDVWDEEEMSQEFDAVASQYMIVLLGPPILGYAAFSLIYMKHKSWYSWVLESGIIYTSICICIH